MFPEEFHGVSRVLHEEFHGVSMVFHEEFHGVSRVFQRSNMEVLGLLGGFFKDISEDFHGCFQDCIKGVL